MSAAAAREFDAIIVGGGVVGSITAGALIKRGLGARGRIALIAERFPSRPAADADWDLRVYALSRASQRLLEAAGVWSSLPRERVTPYERMHVWDAAGEPMGTGSLSFDCAEIGEPNLGHIVDGQQLQWLAFEKAVGEGVVAIEGSLAGLMAQAGQQRLELTDGRELRTRLLLGADGVESSVRRLLGIGTGGHGYAQDALVAHVRTARAHQGSAWQRFLPGGPLAFLPLGDGRSSVVWSVQQARAAALRVLPPAQFGEALTEAGGGVLGRCELTTKVASFPLRLQYAIDYVRAGAALLGDAAHAVHPLAGQGLNLGLLDAAALLEVLAEAGSAAAWGDPKVLRSYERRRRSENLLAAAGLDGLERLFAAADPLTPPLRRWGLAAVGRLPLLKRRLALAALGL